MVFDRNEQKAVVALLGAFVTSKLWTFPTRCSASTPWNATTALHPTKSVSAIVLPCGILKTSCNVPFILSHHH